MTGGHARVLPVEPVRIGCRSRLRSLPVRTNARPNQGRRGARRSPMRSARRAGKRVVATGVRRVVMRPAVALLIQRRGRIGVKIGVGIRRTDATPRPTRNGGLARRSHAILAVSLRRPTRPTDSVLAPTGPPLHLGKARRLLPRSRKKRALRIPPAANRCRWSPTSPGRRVRNRRSTV